MLKPCSRPPESLDNYRVWIKIISARHEIKEYTEYSIAVIFVL